MAAGDPIFSIFITPASTSLITTASFTGSPKRASISSMNFLSKLIVIHDISDTPLFLDLWDDIDAGGATPVISIPIMYRYSASSVPNLLDCHQPRRFTRCDFSIRKTHPYPDGTVVDPTGSKFSMWAFYS